MYTFTPKLAAISAVLAGALLLPALGAAAPIPLVIPSIPGAAQLPGATAAPAAAASTMQLLTTKPDVAVAGTKFTVSGKGLAASKPVSIVWGTSNVTWSVDARPDSVDYLGRSATKTISADSSASRRSTTN